ncbi:hypothetical protein QQ045_013520 [Rhodiola kirilowii]
MRSGLATIQQTLTPEASTVLSHSISEAGRRNHSQVTPLHVAATLLASPSSFLRQACIRSHPNSSHPLQCRALELCFSVALDRLPMTQSSPDAVEPPISNALMAALKRAQAHQRRGCPEQQQQPLLAVKVELEQLIISILDDPSVSRVMREARFSSPAVKATFEKSISASSSSNNLGFSPSSRNNNNMYLNPRLQAGQPAQIQLGQQQSVSLASHFGHHKVDEVQRIVEIMSKDYKRNPVLVGDSQLELILKQLFDKIENKELNQTVFNNVQLVHMEKKIYSDRSQLLENIKELGHLIDEKCSSNNAGVVLNLGDLKWLVDQPGSGRGGGVQGWGAAQPVVCEAGRLAVEEVRKLLVRFGGKLWLIATATCETYLRCQVYHNNMETDWDLQALPVAAKAPLQAAFPRLGTTGFMGYSIQPVTLVKSLTTTPSNGLSRRLSDLDPASNMTCCVKCRESYEMELETVMSTETTSEAGKALLPMWLRTATTTDEQLQANELDKFRQQKTEELTKKWNETCSSLHRSFNHVLGSERLLKPSTPSMTGLLNSKLLNPKLISQQPFQPKLQAQRSFVETTLQLNPTWEPFQSHVSVEKAVAVAGPSPPRSPVRTELALGRSASPEKNQNEATKDFMSCISSNGSIEMQANKLLSSLLDADWLKKLMKTLTDKVWWQREAAAAVATAVAQCKLGNGKQRVAGGKGNNVWLLFTGPDRVGKKKMASALSELVCGLSPVVISFGSRRTDESTNTSFRGRTALDQIGEAIRRNPFSVVVLEDIDEADMLIRGNVQRAIERGRIADSHGRELSLGNVTFILTSNWLPEEFKISAKSYFDDENSLTSIASENWQLKFVISDKTGKRRASCTNDTVHEEERYTRPKKDMNSSSALIFDLNEALDADDDRGNGSGNSSDLTAEHEEDSGNVKNRYSFINSATRELVTHVDSVIVFEPVDFSSIRQRLASSIATSFSSIIRSGRESVQVKDEALKRILSGILLGQTTLEDWLEDVLVPSLQQLKAQLQCHDSEKQTVVQLEVDDDSSLRGSRNVQEWLPSSIRVAMDVQ